MLSNWICGWAGGVSKADDTCRTKSLEGIGGRWLDGDGLMGKSGKNG